MGRDQKLYDELKDSLAAAVTGFLSIVDKFKSTIRRLILLVERP